MSLETLQPVVPPELLPYWDDHAREAHEDLAAQSLDQVVKSMPEAKYSGYEGARYVELSPMEDHDRESAVVLTLPYTNGWKPSMAIRAMALQNILPEPTRLIVFPDNTSSQTAYALSDDQRTDVANGHFDPIADKQAHVLDYLKIERLNVIGYSFGASVGAAALRLAAENSRFELGNSGLFEPPNCLTRKIRELEGAFFSTKLKDLNRAINDSAIPALTDAQRAGGGINNILQTARITKDWIISWSAMTMRSVKRGMASSTLNTDVAAATGANQDFKLTIGGGGDSRIFPIEMQDFFRYTLANQDNSRVSVVSLEGQNHSMGDNVVLHALLARMAIAG